MSTTTEIERVRSIIEENEKHALRAERSIARCRRRLMESFTPTQEARFLRYEDLKAALPGWQANVETFTAALAALEQEAAK